MKKLHLHKIFHWLYAFVMFLPFILFIGYCVINFGLGFTDQTVTDIFFEIVDDLCNVWSFAPLFSVFNWLNNFFDGFTSISALLVYWIIISIYWLVFDVLMYIINVAHHWLDAGGDKL